jgi:hypothetical protein
MTCLHGNPVGDCKTCEFAREMVRRRDERLYGKTIPPRPVPLTNELLEPPCIFRKESAGTITCVCVSGRLNRQVPAYRCELKGVCAVNERWLPKDPNVTLCRLCKERKAEASDRKLVWQVGVTAVSERKSTLLPRTLAGLAKAGWDSPRLFVDGGTCDDWKGSQYPVTVRDKLHGLGNWWLGLHELYARNPMADRFMMVEDDVLFLPNVRQYLDALTWPGEGYLNLYTAPGNTPVAAGRQGFFKVPVHHMGLGALALMFNRDSITKILASAYFVEAFRPIDLKTMTRKPNPHRARMHQDGHAAKAMKAIGWSEYCHFPSIVQHLGEKKGRANAESDCFDEKFDLRGLLK